MTAGKLLDNIGFWTAFLFTAGSVAWVVNGVVLFHGVLTIDVATWSAFIGGTLFLFGGLSMYWEGLNERCKTEFGASTKKLLTRKNPDEGFIDTETQYKTRQTGWRWIGWERSVGFYAGLIQLVAVTVFYVSVVAGLFTATNIWVIWNPQVAGAFLLTVSSVLMVADHQGSIWLLLVGVGNVVGSLGFMLSGIFGYTSLVYWGVYFSTYWGSIAFLLGSLLQLLIVL